MASGFGLNMDKSECKFFGEWSDKEECEWKACSGSIKILGIKFNSDLYGRESWDNVCEKIKKKINFWSLRTLTLEGKALIIKQVLLPIILYIYYMFSAPDRVLKKVIRVFFTFFWSSKLEKLKRKKVMKFRMKGGKGMVNIERFLVLKYVCKS